MPFTKKKEGNSYYKKYLYKIAGQRFIPKIVYYGEKKEQKKTYGLKKQEKENILHGYLLMEKVSWKDLGK